MHLSFLFLNDFGCSNHPADLLLMHSNDCLPIRWILHRTLTYLESLLLLYSKNVRLPLPTRLPLNSVHLSPLWTPALYSHCFHSLMGLLRKE